MRTKFIVKSLCLAAALALAAPGTALAQAPAPSIAAPAVSFAPAPVAAPRVPRRQATGGFTGLYVGGLFGMAMAKSDAFGTFDLNGAGYFANASITDIEAVNPIKAEASKPLFGGTAGFNGQAGSAVIGVEGDFQILQLDETTSATETYTCCGTTFTLGQTITSDWLFSARARAGGVVGSALIYGTGGLAMTKLKLDTLFTDTDSSANASASVEETRKGVVVGGGVEFKAGPHVSIKGEFLHFNFGDFDPIVTNNLVLGTSPRPNETFTAEWTKVRMNVFRVGVNFGF